jgi:mannose-1-phosphate guanylyltransferase
LTEEVFLQHESHRWSILLAGGEGERTKDFVRSLLGYDKPKQYCTFIGRRSLLQHTVDRADVLSAPHRRVIVTRRHHSAEVAIQLRGRDRGTVLYQPSNRGTAVGVFLPLAHALSRDADATVVIYPSDHFVFPEVDFLTAISEAISLTESVDRVLIVGARPDGPETDYGWIRPGAPLAGIGSKVRKVERFVEKPPLAVAEEAARRGGLWNTSIVVARAERLWKLGRHYLPDVTSLLDPVARRLEQAEDPTVLDRIFRSAPVHDFSRELLEPAGPHLAVLEAEGFFWSDWGRPSRILDVVEAMRKGALRGRSLEPRERRVHSLPSRLREPATLASLR